jgi:hypothetical protein
MWAWVRSWPLKAKLPGGAFAARLGPIVPESSLTSAGLAEATVVKNRQHGDGTAEVVGDQQKAARRVNAHIGRPAAAGVHRVQQLSASRTWIDREGADRPLVRVPNSVGLVRRIEPVRAAFMARGNWGSCPVRTRRSASARRCGGQPEKCGSLAHCREANQPAWAARRGAAS